MQKIINLVCLNNFILLSTFLIAFTQISVAQNTLDAFWREEIANRNINVSNTSYCFIDREGKIQGINVSKNFPIASLSKIITSLASLRHFANGYYQFTTTVYFSEKMKALHFESNGDPTLSDEKLWLILSYLNNKNIQHLDHITFNSQFFFMPHVNRIPQYEHQWVEGDIVKLGPYIPFPSETLKFLNTYLMVSKYDEYVKKNLLAAAEQNSEIHKNLNFSFETITHSNENPLLAADDVQKFTLTSQPLIQILKSLNTYSNNPMADILHFLIGGEAFILDSLRGILPPEDLKQMKWFTGSGLPFTIMEPTKTTRHLNLLSCKGMLFVKDHFRHLVDAFALNSPASLPRPTEIFSQGLLKTLPVSGQEGTISSYRDFTNIFVGKTGTLNEAKMLSTFISANSGIRLLTMMGVAPKRYLNRLADTYKLMLSQAIKAFRGAQPFDYSPPDTFFQGKTPTIALNNELFHKLRSFTNTEDQIQFLINDSRCQEDNCLYLVQKLIQKFIKKEKRKSTVAFSSTATDDDSLIFHAIVSNKAFIVKELLNAGADPNATIYNTQTPLFFLGVHQNLEMLKILMSNPKVNIHLKNSQGLRIYDYAQKYAFSEDMKKYLHSFFKAPNL